jgi:hypothetical protein
MRQKHVFKTDMVAHVWAQQSQDAGRNPQGNFFFQGPTIYSYRTGYPIATIVSRKGQRVTLMRTDSYSMTTGRHISLTRRAVNGNVFRVAHGYEGTAKPDHKANREDYARRLDDATLRAARARSSTRAMDEAGRIAREANEYAEFFGLTWRLVVPVWSDQYRDEVRKRARAVAAAKAVETRKREEARRAEAMERILKWRAGESVSLWDCPDTLLRVKGNRIETSRGAEVPLRVAPAVWALVQEARNKGEKILPGLELGHFRLDAVAPDGTIVAGCHVIKYEELSALAAQLKL